MLSEDIVVTGNRAIARSYAKINLTLDVLGKRTNGYHDVKMIMQTVSLFDLIIVDKISAGITVNTNLKYLPNNDKNIAYKAAQLFFEKTGLSGGARIIIHKNIPVAAGLAGGSGNGAAVLCALNTLFNAGLSDGELCALGAELGADVPYCITGGTQLATGVGEILEPLPPMKKTTVLIVKPPISVSTGSVYERIDSAPIGKRPDEEKLIEGLRSGNTAAVAENLCNVMESVTETMYPAIGGIKKKMLINGAVGAVMSGSGPSVFGLFDDDKKAKLSHDSFAYQYKDVFLVKTLN